MAEESETSSRFRDRRDQAECTKSQPTQTYPVSFQLTMERFEDDFQLVASMANNRHADALNLVNEILKTQSLPIEERFKYKLLRLECHLYLYMFIEAREDGPTIIDMASKTMQINESEIASIAYKCRQNRYFVRAMLYYQCSLQCWLREMRRGKIKNRSIEVINRAEKFALVVYHIGLSADTRGIMYEYALQVFRAFIKDYENGPEKLNVHRDLTIMGCCYYIGDTLRKLNDPKQSLNFTTHGINIGMKTIKDHKNHLVAKSHLLAAQCYLSLKEWDNAEMWLEFALKLCPLISNWDYQSSTETRKEFEEEVKNCLADVKSSRSST